MNREWNLSLVNEIVSNVAFCVCTQAPFGIFATLVRAMVRTDPVEGVIF